MTEEIITVKTPYWTRYELKDICGNSWPIIKPESSCPYIVIENERVNLVPNMRKALRAAMEENR